MPNAKRKNVRQMPVLEDWHKNRKFHPVEAVNERYYQAGARWYAVNKIPGSIAAVDPTRPKVDGGLGAAGLQGRKADEADERNNLKLWRFRLGATLSRVLDLVVRDEKSIPEAAVVLFGNANHSNNAVTKQNSAHNTATRKLFLAALEVLIPMALSSTSKDD